MSGVKRRVAFLTLFGLAVLALGGAAAIKIRGLRASATPSAIESSTALFIRNFSIPRAERTRTNPHAGDDAAVRDGRSVFLARCASCHGVDGRGATAIGRNVYPRVPDLGASRTQGLTDGELRYIIQYGVQLTAMPALAVAGGEGERVSWNLVAFVRTLRALASEAATTTAVPDAHYAGSASCERCHTAIYNHWKQTPMANVVRDPHAHPEAVLPDLRTNHVAPFTIEQVALVYGSKWKQRYFTRIGDDFYPLPVQWDVGNKAWRPYHVADTGADWWTEYYPSDNLQRPTGPTCDGCHSVNYDIAARKPTEWNVGCESCHGPGSTHVAHPTSTNIFGASWAQPVASNDSCIQCHSQGRPTTPVIDGKAYDWPVGYRAGARLQELWTLEDAALGQTTFLHFADGTAHKNRMQGNDFVQSLMYARGVTCASCHDAHGTPYDGELRKPANQICLDCHAANGPNGPRAASLAAHTHHKDGSAGAECVACHMPKIATEGVPGAFVRSHTFRFITPSMTDRLKIPNPCTSCHTDRSTAWSSEALGSWSDSSSWRTR